MLIPSAQAVWRSATERVENYSDQDLFSPIKTYTDNELEIERVLLTELANLKIPAKSVRKELSSTLLVVNGSNNKSKLYPNAHPSELGYTVYAKTANEVLNQMLMKRIKRPGS